MWLMSEPGLGKPQMAPVSRTPHAERARPVVECKTTGRSRHLADDGRHFTDRAVRFAGIVVGIVNAAPVVIFSVAQHPVSRRPVAEAAVPPCGSLGHDRVGRTDAVSSTAVSSNRWRACVAAVCPARVWAVGRYAPRGRRR